MPHFLQACLEQFQETAFSRHRRSPDFSAIEAVGQQLREADPLTFEALRQLFQACRAHHWWFEEYWDPPERTGPLSVSFLLSHFNEQTEKQGIRELLNELKHIELVSIVLRFVRPDRYGILSPPVQRILNVAWGSDAVETYLNYLRNLHELQRAIGFKTAAETDMSLWVLHAKCFGGEAQNRQFLEFYNSDPQLLDLRAQNLLGPFQRLPKSIFAKALLAVRSDLAAVVACYLFEIAVRTHAQHLGVYSQGEIPLAMVLKDLRGRIGRPVLRHWHSLKKIRNDLFHHDKQPSIPQINEVINAIESIE